MTNMRKIEWCGLPRQAIPGVMLGMERSAAVPRTHAEHALADSSDIAVAFFTDEPRDERLPCLAVIPDSKIAELLSWVHTFSPETFPLSQHCRILSLSEWQKFEAAPNDHPGIQQRYRWASLVAGEMLGQAEGSAPIASVSLSWAHGCLSYSMARSVLGYGMSSDSKIHSAISVAGRLLQCEADPMFQRKRVGSNVLSSIWPHVRDTNLGFSNEPLYIVRSVLREVSPELVDILYRNELILSSSAERRVQGFDQIVDRTMSLPATSRRAVGPLLASATFLVGRGTSHIDLLEPFSKECPEAYIWLGLLAGLGGPMTWDPTWLRLVKGVDRVLAAGYEVTDSPQVDLSWAEYDWLSKLSTQAEEYAALPKQSTRALTVELIPGVACQFRLGGRNGAKTEQTYSAHSNAADRVPQQPPVREPVSNELIDKALALLGELQSVLTAGPARSDKQASLFTSPSTSPPRKKAAPAKKAGKAAGKTS
ncbi:hypothetical protein [Cupriavidus agavae]|uniref:Uncharacterized protein n=1 Tax=Cupriavidus agavae TaxID=1001822 RepID=A0A4Q7S758_9BURK|nr:hypothetical protein [Cupriavidus agavae]RZT41717.1 hypothetical protein EV147_0717 [Cupriavidus agavae]